MIDKRDPCDVQVGECVQFFDQGMNPPYAAIVVEVFGTTQLGLAVFMDGLFHYRKWVLHRDSHLRLGDIESVWDWVPRPDNGGEQ